VRAGTRHCTSEVQDDGGHFLSTENPLKGNYVKKSDTDYSSRGSLPKPGGGDVNVSANPNAGAPAPRSRYNANIDVHAAATDPEGKKYAKILREALSADGLAVMRKGDLRGTKM
jgi:hypothetical protein